MKLVDTRKLSQNAQEAIRLRAIKLVIVDGESRTQAARFLEVSRVSVSNRVSAYQKKGEGAVRGSPFFGYEASPASSMRYNR